MMSSRLWTGSWKNTGLCEAPAMEKQIHTIPPVFDGRSRVLILGSFPSVKSRQVQFYYGNPQNRFWNVLAGVLGETAPDTAEDRRRFLLTHGIALWDVIASCTISGSADSSIRDAVPNDLSLLLNRAPIRRIYTNGTTAARLYHRLLLPQTGREAVTLPSTSPANASYSLERLIECWKVIAPEAEPFSSR